MDRGACLLALLALTVPFVGCLGTARDVDPVPTVAARPLEGDGETDAQALAPTWALGDAWSVETTGNGTPKASTLVVTSVDESGYVVSTTDESLAAYDALRDVSYVGLLRKSDLAGSQGETPVQFFSFPLTDGKTWATTWDGREVTLVARWVPAMETSVGTHAGFTIEGRAGEEPFVKYDYVPTLRWWSHLSFADGYGFRVERVHSAWSGEYYMARAETILESGGETAIGGANALTFTVGEGQRFVSLTLEGSSTLHARALVLQQPDGRVQSTSSPTVQGGSGEVFLEERLPPEPGAWRVHAPLLHHPDSAFRLLVRQVQIEPRTFQPA